MKRLFPDEPLGEPVKGFDETFSAETVYWWKHSSQFASNALIAKDMAASE